MLIARAVVMLGMFVNGVIIARSLGPSELGRYYYVYAASMVGVQVAFLGMHASNTYFYAQKPELLGQVIANFVFVALFAGLAAGVGILIVDQAFFERSGGASIMLVLLLCPMLLFNLGLQNLSVAIDTGLFNRLLLLQVALIILGTVLVALNGPSPRAYLLTLLAANVVVGGVALFRVARGVDISYTFDRALFQEMIAYGIRAHLVVLMTFVMSRLGVFVLRWNDAIADLGQWSVASQIIDAMLVIPGTVCIALFPHLVRTKESSRWKELRLPVVTLFLGMALICAVFALVAQPLITFVFGGSYQPAVGIVMALLPSVVLLTITTVMSQYLSAFGVPLMQILGWGAALLFQLIVSVLVHPLYGVVGLALVQSAAAAVICGWLWLTAFRHSNVVAESSC